MHLSHIIGTGITAVLAATLATTPAPAQQMPAPSVPEGTYSPAAQATGYYEAAGADAGMRARWVDDCANRIGEGRRSAREECMRYLNEYYASYQRGGYGYAQPGYAQSGYTQPQMMMVPAAQTRAAPHCTETVEVVYEDVQVAVRPRIQRRIDKRVRIAPDKRVRIGE